MNPFQNKKQPKKEIEPSDFWVEEFTGCCTARTFDSFDNDTADQIIARCNEVIPLIKNEGAGVVIAITTSIQKEAAKAFTRMGFYTNPKPMKKNNNPETGDLFIWFMPTHEFKPVKL